MAKGIRKNVGAFAESVCRVRTLTFELGIYVKEGLTEQPIVGCARDIAD